MVLNILNKTGLGLQNKLEKVQRGLTVYTSSADRVRLSSIVTWTPASWRANAVRLHRRWCLKTTEHFLSRREVYKCSTHKQCIDIITLPFFLNTKVLALPQLGKLVFLFGWFFSTLDSWSHIVIIWIQLWCFRSIEYILCVLDNWSHFQFPHYSLALVGVVNWQ